MITFAELTTITSGQIIQMPEPDRSIQYLLTDSRSGIQNEASLFFAISGERHNGHNYLNELYNKGVRQFVVEQTPNSSFPEANVLLVNDSITTLQKIAAHHRQQFTIPIIGITGSNGKTIVKEWLSQLLMTTEQVVRNPKSYNSRIGVPLSVWSANHKHSVGVFEAGISQVGEMKKLADVLQPTLGIFTNIGSSHDEGFDNRQQKVEEKSQLFGSASTITYRQDYPLIDEVIKEQYGEQRSCSWSTEDSNHPNYFVQWNHRKAATEVVVRKTDRQESQIFSVPFQDKASLENITHCLIFGIQNGYDVERWSDTLIQLQPVSMRLEWKQGINQCYLVDDSYSNDLQSLQLALDFLIQQSQNKKCTVILSDILQSGEDSDELYRKLADLLLQKNIDRLIGIGPAIVQQSVRFKPLPIEVIFFPNTEAFLESPTSGQFFQENILIKGARIFQFERIAHRLQQKIHSTVLEINLDAITHNLNQYRSKLAASTKLMVMVKAFSYGGASFEIANLLQFHQVDYLGVAYADEGVRLREHGIRTPIVVLNPAPEAFEKMLEYRLEPEIYSLRLLQLFIRNLGAQASDLPIHLKLDTGMHRLGFVHSEITPLVSTLGSHQLKVGSVFSHLAAADDAQHDEFTEQQIQQFQRGYKQITDGLGYRPIRHILNSAGMVRFPQYQYEMVRLGIGLYGVDSSGQEPERLQTVGTLKTVISQIKYLKQGETVGYGRRGVADQDITIATIAIGYADGFDRGFGSGNTKVLINGQLASTVGSICMDMTMIDITDVDAQEGDEVIIFGSEISVESLAQKINTIPYEILTNIGERVKRVFYRES